MDYELAVQLKEAGFPIKKHLITRYKRDIAVPTLEELIAACEEEYLTIEHRNISGSRDWLATAHTLNQGNQSGVGSTPIEAVARVWLALHSK
jgi:hypothetical protein